MAGLRKIVDEADARACLAAVERSGDSRRAWARQHGIDARSLRAWELNLSRSSVMTVAETDAKLVELVPVSSPASSARYVVRVGVGTVEMGDDFDDSTLRRIVEVLRSC